MNHEQYPHVNKLILRRLLFITLPIVIILGVIFYQYIIVNAAGTLTVEILSADNLVVDSNATSPSTYAPSVATVAGKFCNTGDEDLTDVQGFIGEFSGGTPGTYPVRSSGSGTFDTDHPHLVGSGSYSFTQLGGASEANRYIGTLTPGQCSVQYWSFTYPQCENTGGGTPESPPCSLDPVWGGSVKPDDDLYLYYDVWGTSAESSNANATKKMTMRNEISAMANKIEPNPDGRWFVTEKSVVRAGEMITSNGIKYTFGNVNKGFDNDGDGFWDYNAWMQPYSDPSYDPGCFRLISTTGVLTVTRSSNPPLILNFTDKLYFTYPDIPADNTGVVGEVHYTFMALNGVCVSPLTPYQEAASGKDNEKFNGDFGTSAPPIKSITPEVTIDKASNPDKVVLGGTITYDIDFQNAATDGSFGITLSSGLGVNMPLVISDTVPAGLEYSGGSAATSFTSCAGCTATIRVSTDSGRTWGDEPVSNVLSSAPNNLVVIRWWLDQPLTAGASGTATFQADVPVGYSGNNFIENDACASVGDAEPFACDDVVTLIQGTASITGIVWEDKDNNGLKAGVATEPGIYGANGVPVYLYWDKNGDGALDDSDMLLETSNTTSTNDPNYSFTNLPPGDYLVEVNTTDSDIPRGYRPTTPTEIAVTGLTAGATDSGNDFGFGPTLNVVKVLKSANGTGDGGLATFNIDLTNQRPGDGTSDSYCRYDVWATIDIPDNSDTPEGGNSSNAQWKDTANALYARDGIYSFTEMNDNSDKLGLSGFNIGEQKGNITKVELVVYTKEIIEFKATDEFEMHVYQNDVSIQSYVYNGTTHLTGPVGAEYTFIEDLTGLPGTWAWSDFSNDWTELQLIGDKGGGSGNSGDIAVDAAAYRITTDQKCGGADDTILTLPLTDTYDADLMTFISAIPTQDSATTSGSPNSTVGTITWDDLGPLYPGETKTLTLTFRILEPSTDTAQNIDIAEVENAYFYNGKRTNDDSDEAEVPRASITGKVWSDVGTIGWVNPDGYQSGTDTFVPNVTVELWGCYNTASNKLITSSDSGFQTGDNCAQQDIDGNNNIGEWRQIFTDTTDANGDFLFVGLDQGFYYTQVDNTTFPHGTATQTAEATQPSGGQTCGTCNHRWGDPSADLSPSNFNEIDSNDEDITTVNFGYTVPATVFGTVWRDVDGDGTRDSGDAGLSGATVELYDGTCTVGTDCPTTVTNASGYYSFTNQVAGTYRVYVRESTLPSGYSQTVDPDDATPPCSGAECDGRTNDIGLSAGQVDGSYDFAYTFTGSATLGDTVYRDWNGDGDQDTGEEGISGLTLRLYYDNEGDGVIDPTDAVVDTQTTDSSGSYTFSNLPDGDYIVQVIDPPTSTQQTEDPDDTLDHIARKININSGIATINGGNCGGSCNDDVDFGYQPYGFGSIGDFVWEDTNGNGEYDSGESGLDGVTVWLYEDTDNNGTIDANDALVATTASVSGGSYSFTNLPAGNYLVNVDTNVTIGSDTYTVTTTKPHGVTLSDNQVYTDADFGYVNGGATIGDRVWQDNDGDGLQDDNEPGIQNVQVWLCDYTASPCNAGSAIATATTNTNGIYSFTNQSAYTYTVAINTATLPSGTVQTYDPDEPNGEVPCVTCDNQSTDIFVTTGQIDFSHDFGYQPAGNIGDTLWVDTNLNGVPDAGEPSISYITVWLYDCGPDNTCGNVDDVLQATTETDTSGKYSFGNISTGNYNVRVDTGDADFPGVTQTYDPDVANPCIGASCDSIGLVSIVGGSDDFTLDFGYKYTGSNSVSGTVFFDVNNNGGIYNSGPGTDLPIGNITVNLFNSNGDLVDTTQTAADGSYSFANLPNDNYTIATDMSAPQLQYMTQMYEPDEAGDDGNCTTGALSCNNRTTVNLPGSTNLTNEDFSIYANMDCGDLPATYNLNPTQYQTTLAKEGPCHIRESGDTDLHYLGTLWDAEPDGQSVSEAAIDDDNSISDDEDGITFYGDSVSGFNDWATLAQTGGGMRWISAAVNGSNAYLAGWFDWNNDGDFTDAATSSYDAGEYTYFGEVTTGDNALSVTVPDCSALSNCFADDGVLYTRFRLYQGSSPPPVIAPTGNVMDGEVEDHRRPEAPTAVTLYNFDATGGVNFVRLNWVTVLEIDVLGFNLYSSTDFSDKLPSLNARQLNTELIPAKLLGGMSSLYEFVDPDVHAGATYYYWLEVIGTDGAKEVFGPIDATGLYGLFIPVINR